MGKSLDHGNKDDDDAFLPFFVLICCIVEEPISPFLPSSDRENAPLSWESLGRREILSSEFEGASTSLFECAILRDPG